jgi:hypothetical protein
MANAFKTYNSQSIGTTLMKVGNHLVASGNTETIIGMTVANRTASAVKVNVVFETVSNTQTYIVKDAPVPAGGSLVPIGGDQKIVLNVNECIRVSSNTASSVDAIMSVLQQN